MYFTVSFLYCYMLYLYYLTECSPLPKLENGLIQLRNTERTTFARFKCNTGYRLVGMNIRLVKTCRNWAFLDPKEKWTSGKPFCSK